MGCQRSIARQIIDAGTDYLPAAKPITLRPIPVSLNFTLQLNNYRRRSVAKWPSSITMRLKAMVASRHVTAPRSTGRRSTRSPPLKQRRYFVTSLPANDPARIALAIHFRWAIQSMHWALDVSFGEDQCRARVKNVAQNFAILRRIALNFLKQGNQGRHQATPPQGLCES